MLSRYRELDLVNVGEVDAYVSSDLPKLDLESPAYQVMTDFMTTHPVVICETTPVDDALKLMKDACVRLLLVTAADNVAFRGIVTASHINGGRLLSFMAANDIHNRSEVAVKYIMTPRSEIHAFRYEEIECGRIGDVVATINHLGEQHMLVVEENGDHPVIRGMYSTVDIASALQVGFDVEPHARTFFQLEQAILHHDHV